MSRVTRRRHQVDASQSGVRLDLSRCLLDCDPAFAVCANCENQVVCRPRQAPALAPDRWRPSSLSFQPSSSRFGPVFRLSKTCSVVLYRARSFRVLSRVPRSALHSTNSFWTGSKTIDPGSLPRKSSNSIAGSVNSLPGSSESNTLTLTSEFRTASGDKHRFVAWSTCAAFCCWICCPLWSQIYADHSP